MALESFTLRRDTPTISFNPYRDPTARPTESGAGPPAQDDSISSDVLNKQIGLGLGLSAFLLSTIGLLGYGIFRRAQTRRQRQEMSTQTMEERQGIARAPSEPPQTPSDRETGDMVGATSDDAEARSKHSSIDERADGPERGESSLSGGIAQPTYEPGFADRTSQRRTQSLQESESNERNTSPVHR